MILGSDSNTPDFLDKSEMTCLKSHEIQLPLYWRSLFHLFGSGEVLRKYEARIHHAFFLLYNSNSACPALMMKTTGALGIAA
jgi:hypothetical protein